MGQYYNILMKEENKNRCPGCGKHCGAKNPGCGYGRKYFGKEDSKEKKHASVDAYFSCKGYMGERKANHAKPAKWEKYTQHDGLAWKLLSAGRSVKSALRQGEMVEEEYFSVLSAEEKQMLMELLGKLHGRNRYAG